MMMTFGFLNENISFHVRPLEVFAAAFGFERIKQYRSKTNNHRITLDGRASLDYYIQMPKRA